MTAHVIIKKQKIKIRTADEPLAFQIRKQLNDALQFDLIEMLERTFAGYELPENLYVNIDKLSVDLGRLSPKDFENHFLELLEPKLMTELQKKLSSDAAAAYRNADKDQTSYSVIDRQQVQINAREEQELADLFYFLVKGIYPWWYKKADQISPGRLLENLSANEIEGLLLRILSFNKRNNEDETERLIRRIFIHLPASRHKDFIHRLLALYNNQTLTENIETLIKNSPELMETFLMTNTDFYTRVFQYVVSEPEDYDKNIIRKFLHQIKDEQTADNNQRPKETINRKKGRETDSDGVYIGNAGLVLLHPFLPVLFDELGLLDEAKQFTSISAQQKATVLLYYVQCGADEYKEWEMALNKILCGLDSRELIPDGIALTENEKNECRYMLKTVVNYWEALKGASIESLQNSFILREGKLSWKEDRCLIQVERTGVDILLERLPWGYGTFKFPWLDYLIFTEW